MTKKPKSEGRHRGSLDRNAIVETATELFAQKNYRAASLDDIAGALGVKKTSIYYYFGSKEEILLAIYDRFYALADQHIVPIIKSELPPQEKLRRVAHAYFSVVAANPEIINATARTEFELSPKAQKAILRKNSQLERLFGQVVEEGQALGVFRKVTPRLIALMVMGTIECMAEWSSVAGRAIDPHQTAAEFVLLMESGWLESGQDKKGAWPRPHSLEDAFVDPMQRIGELEETIKRLAEDMERTRDRLTDGLASHPLGNTGDASV